MRPSSTLLRVGGAGAVSLALAACVASTATDDIGSTESAVTTVCGQTTVKGIDVYHGDNASKAIDWNAVKGAGIAFGFAKATESTGFTDSMFAANWAGMKSAGLVRGAYHFFHADVDAVAQANFFLATISAAGGALEPGDLLVLDLETTNGQTDAVIEAHAATFLATVKSASGVLPILYTSPLFLGSFAQLGDYPLWVANYGVSCPLVPSPWTTYSFWQSTGTGSLGPISGALDLDTFNGSASDLQAFATGTWLAGADAGAASDAGPANDAGGAAGDAQPDGSIASGSSHGCSIGSAAGKGGTDERVLFPGLLGLVALLRRRVPKRPRVG